MSKKVSGWPLIVPKEVDTSITGDQVLEALAADVEASDSGKVLTATYSGLEGEETASVIWASPLPIIGEGDAGKVLTVGEDGPEWAELPEGLPEIAAVDEGKVLTVVGEAEPVTTYYLPVQTITLTTGQGTATGADFSGLSDGDKATLTLTIDGKTTTTEGELWGTAFAFGKSSDIDSSGAVNLSAIDVGFTVLEMSGAKTATLSISATTEGEKVYSAQWETPSGGDTEILIVNITGEAWNQSANCYTGTTDKSVSEIQAAVLAGKQVYLRSTAAYNDKLLYLALTGGSSTDIYFESPVMFGSYSGTKATVVALSATLTGTSVEIYAGWYEFLATDVS